MGGDQWALEEAARFREGIIENISGEAKNLESEGKNSWVHGGRSCAQGRGSWMGAETKVVINGPQGEKSLGKGVSRFREAVFEGLEKATGSKEE